MPPMKFMEFSYVPQKNQLQVVQPKTKSIHCEYHTDTAHLIRYTGVVLDTTAYTLVSSHNVANICLVATAHIILLGS